MNSLDHLREVSDDGLEPAEYALHTLEKLSIVHYYLDGFDRACTSTKPYGGWTYVDSFAGSGYVRVRPTDRIFEGSALIGLRSGASSVIAIEARNERARVLEQRLARTNLRVDCRVNPGDANEVLGGLLSAVNPRTPVFVFHDPEGTELSWQTVRMVATGSQSRRRKPEQLINFTAGILRLLWLEDEIPRANKHALNRFFGSPDWSELHERRRAGQLLAHEILNEAVEFYKRRLKDELGYRHVVYKGIRRDNVTQGPPAYHLVFASDHEAAPRIMNAAFKKGFVGQLPMLGM